MGMCSGESRRSRAFKVRYLLSNCTCEELPIAQLIWANSPCLIKYSIQIATYILLNTIRHVPNKSGIDFFLRSWTIPPWQWLHNTALADSLLPSQSKVHFTKTKLAQQLCKARIPTLASPCQLHQTRPAGSAVPSTCVEFPCLHWCLHWSACLQWHQFHP